jgi:RND superfamily putative drug exporter
MFFQFGKFIHRRQWAILSFWILLICVCFFLLFQGGGAFKIGGFTDPHRESSIASDLLTKKIGHSTSRFIVLYSHKSWLANSTKFNDEIKQSLADLKNFSVKHRIVYPDHQNDQISKDKHTAYAIVLLEGSTEKNANLLSEFKSLLHQPPHLKMLVGGDSAFTAEVKTYSVADLYRADFIAIPIAIITMLFVFGSLVAASLPIILSLITVLIVLVTLMTLGHFMDLSVFSLNVATMLGLSLTLDYALFIITRFRDELKRTHSIHEAITITQGTAGKAVFFSGLIVLTSLSALLIFPINILFSIGLAGVIVVFVSMLTSLFLLPTLLILIGKKIDAVPVRLFKFKRNQDRKTFWYYLANTVMRHPLLFFFPTIFVLLMLGSPFMKVVLNRPDEAILPPAAESRQVFDTFKEKFNESELTPILVVIESTKDRILSPKNIDKIYNFAQIIEKDARVEKIESIVTIEPEFNKQQYKQLYSLPPNQMDPQLTKFLKDTTRKYLTVMTVISQYPSNSDKTYDLVKKIRHTDPGVGLKVQVTGSSASIIDSLNSLYDVTPYALLLIISFTYFVLLILFRSIILPIKAIIMNTLSILASYGMLVFVFQQGHFSDWLNFNTIGYIDLDLPIIMFCILFGISMDYEVFLLSYIYEHYLKSKDNTASVAVGLQRSGKIITSAALIIVLVASSFIASDVVIIKALALGLALAVAIDAIIVRTLLVPASMRLLGKWNWYLPKWLDRILPRNHGSHTI